MHVLARNANRYWRTWHATGDTRYMSPMHILDQVLSSPHRTADPVEAHFFLVPAVHWNGCWGTSEVYYRAHRYISTVFPFWNASGGSDHVWLSSADVGSCATPYGSLAYEMALSTVLTNWGGITGLDGKLKERCYEAQRDVVVPSVFNPTSLLRSPFWVTEVSPTVALAAAAAAAQRNAVKAEAAAAAVLAASAAAPSTMQAAAPSASVSQWPSAVQAAVSRRSALLPPLLLRTTQLFFAGSLCWPLFMKVETAAELEQKCLISDRGKGKKSTTPVARYSFGIRYEVFLRHASVPGFRILPTDFPSAIKGKVSSFDEEMASARFCLAPTGSGYGQRAVHAVLYGCVPVLVQHDGEHPHVAQPFEPWLLSWDDFSVRVPRDRIGDLPAILDAVNLTQKQQVLRHVWTRMLWSSTLPPSLRPHLPGMDAFASTMEAMRELKHSLPPGLPRGVRTQVASE